MYGVNKYDKWDETLFLDARVCAGYFVTKYINESAFNTYIDFKFESLFIDTPQIVAMY